MKACRRLVGALALLILAVGCATPVGVRRAGEATIYRQLNANGLSGREPGAYSDQFLQRFSLARRFQQKPAEVLEQLRAGLNGADRHDRMFALSELSFVHAQHGGGQPYYLAAAVYAYAFLFPPTAAEVPQGYDPRMREAFDIYNRGIVNALRNRAGQSLDASPQTAKLPWGTLTIRRDETGFYYGGYALNQFAPVDDFAIRGLRNRYRRAGIGAPLACAVAATTTTKPNPWIASRAKVPVTMLLRFEDVERLIEHGTGTAMLEMHDADRQPDVAIGGQRIPLECDPSASLAYSLEGSALWDFELAGFRRGDFQLNKGEERKLFFIKPYQPGQIPVVFVHGTASSPARWAEMLNELLGDPHLASRYQFWFYLYNSGNPVALSAMGLRESLQQAVRELDPAATDPALQQMVVIGHSQGGLLTKLTAVESGDKFWRNVTKTPFDDTSLSSATKDLARRSMFVKPLPFVRTLIFIATPHRGSFLTEHWLGSIGRKLVNLPSALTKTGLELVKLNPEGARQTIRIPTALDNMDWSNPYLRTLAELPIRPQVKAYSIVAVKGNGPVEKGDDGVVRYTSAHLKGVASELVVRSGHSTQSDPRTIEEVRRILRIQ